MELDDLIKKLMTSEELATSRVGILAAKQEPSRIVADSAETLSIDVSISDGIGPVCELILADLRERSVTALPVAVGRLARDGIIVAVVRAPFAEAAAQAIAKSGLDWIAILPADGVNRFVVGATEIHPAEFGPLFVDHLAYPVRSTCMHLPQNRHDRRRRRFVRRYGRERMMTLARGLHDAHGDAVRRVITGIEVLAGERPAKPDSAGRRPGMFSLPDIEIEPWPKTDRWLRLQHLMDICHTYGQDVCRELRDFVGSRSFSAYLEDDYNKNKFQLSDAGLWRALRIIDWRNPSPELPPHCCRTREMLSALASQISGEVNILRIAPTSTLPPHYDDFDCEVYIHLGLTIPSGCGIRVAGETRIWEEGRALAFCPAFLHEVWNQSENPRDVVAIDTWHPDLTDIEIQAVHQVRTELEVLRKERQKTDQQN